ncbi:uncharacterized protein [Heterodontus francisci]|uniref:uncharacterized protein n=1 Tax=Heterodontus francisci TaxID=7792 RepID=UPI00355C75AE
MQQQEIDFDFFDQAGNQPNKTDGVEFIDQEGKQPNKTDGVEFIDQEGMQEQETDFDFINQAGKQLTERDGVEFIEQEENYENEEEPFSLLESSFVFQERKESGEELTDFLNEQKSSSKDEGKKAKKGPEDFLEQNKPASDFKGKMPLTKGSETAQGKGRKGSTNGQKYKLKEIKVPEVSSRASSLSQDKPVHQLLHNLSSSYFYIGNDKHCSFLRFLMLLFFVN